MIQKARKQIFLEHEVDNGTKSSPPFLTASAHVLGVSQSLNLFSAGKSRKQGELFWKQVVLSCAYWLNKTHMQFRDDDLVRHTHCSSCG